MIDDLHNCGFFSEVLFNTFPPTDAATQKHQLLEKTLAMPQHPTTAIGRSLHSGLDDITEI